MNIFFRSLFAVPVLLGLMTSSVVLPSVAHAQPWGGGHGRWAGPMRGGPGPGPGWHRHREWGRGAVVGGVLGGLALGTVAGMAIANSGPPVAYGPPPPPPPVYVAPAPYVVVPVAPAYGGYGGYSGW